MPFVQRYVTAAECERVVETTSDGVELMCESRLFTERLDQTPDQLKVAVVQHGWSTDDGLWCPKHTEPVT